MTGRCGSRRRCSPSQVWVWLGRARSPGQWGVIEAGCMSIARAIGRAAPSRWRSSGGAPAERASSKAMSWHAPRNSSPRTCPTARSPRRLGCPSRRSARASRTAAWCARRAPGGRVPGRSAPRLRLRARRAREATRMPRVRAVWRRRGRRSAPWRRPGCWWKRCRGSPRPSRWPRRACWWRCPPCSGRASSRWDSSSTGV